MGKKIKRINSVLLKIFQYLCNFILYNYSPLFQSVYRSFAFCKVLRNQNVKMEQDIFETPDKFEFKVAGSQHALSKSAQLRMKLRSATVWIQIGERSRSSIPCPANLPHLSSKLALRMNSALFCLVTLVIRTKLYYRRCRVKTSICAENDLLIVLKTIYSCAYCVKLLYS